MKTQKYTQKTQANQRYLENLANLRKEFGLDFRYDQIKKQGDIFVVQRKPIVHQARDGEDDGNKMSIYTAREWEMMEYAQSLIRGYKGSKGKGRHQVPGRFFDEEDYDEGKAIEGGVRAGLFR